MVLVSKRLWPLPLLTHIFVWLSFTHATGAQDPSLGLRARSKTCGTHDLTCSGGLNESSSLIQSKFRETNTHARRTEHRLASCDSRHALCAWDFEVRSDLAEAVSDVGDQERRLAQCKALRSASTKSKLVFQHIPKNAGKAVEKFLRIDNLNHISMRQKKPYPDPPPNYMVVLRHPIERMLSWYNFLKAGNAQKDYVNRQRHFCKEGTGKDYAQECIPKVSLYDFIANNHSIFEYSYLYGHEPEHGDSEPVGTDANFMLEFLKPNDDSTIADVKQFLMERFALVGDTRQFETFLQHSGVLVLGMNSSAVAARIRDMMQVHTNPTVHGRVEDMFTKEEYTNLAKRHALDIELYYWGVNQVNALKTCFADPAVSLLQQPSGLDADAQWWDFES